MRLFVSVASVEISCPPICKILATPLYLHMFPYVYCACVVCVHDCASANCVGVSVCAVCGYESMCWCVCAPVCDHACVCGVSNICTPNKCIISKIAGFTEHF